MKTIGLIGGITWHSTLDYYRLINEGVNNKLGGAHSAKLIINSVDFADIKILTQTEKWDEIAAVMIDAAKALERAGVACVMLGANTMHNIAEKVQSAINIPLIHIAEATALAIENKKLKTVALLGTKYTMQLDFYKRILAQHGISTIIPGDDDIEYINYTIYEEFSKGIFLPETKEKYLAIIDKLVKNGAEGIILGCTEIPILLKQDDCDVPLFDTAFIHSMAAMDFAMKA